MFKIFLIFFLLTNILFSNEEEIKIIITKRITDFITWPKEKEEFNIAVYKNSKTAQKMANIYQDKKIQDKKVNIVNIQDFENINFDKINLIYFTKEVNSKTKKIIKKSLEKPILLITDYPDDVYLGMHIGLYFKDKKINFLINTESLEKSQLKASYKLLKHAKIIKGIK